MHLMKFFTVLAVLLLAVTGVHAKEQLMVKSLQPRKGVDTQTAEALSDIIKSTLGEYYSVQSMDALAALSSVVEEKLKAGCDDTKCLIEVAGAMDIGLVATGSISKLGSLYTLNMQLISTRGANLGVIQRASEACRCSEEELVALSRRVALQLIGKTSSPHVAASSQRTPAPPAAATPSGERFTNSIGQEFVYIKPGTFMMGSPSNESGRLDNEHQHQVTLTKGYYMQTTEVTVGQWRAFAQSSGYRSEAETDGGAYTFVGNAWEMQSRIYWGNPGFAQTDNHPVTCVSWNDTQRFIQWLNQRESTNKYRLPTEAEWEYAARAGTTGPFAFGGCLSTDDANYDGNYPLEGCSKGQYRQTPVRVGSFSSNAWGLYDMHGNVLEWSQDWYGDYPSGSVIDPTGPSTGSERVCRGGGWGSNAKGCRSAFPDSFPPVLRFSCLRFRLVADN